MVREFKFARVMPLARPMSSLIERQLDTVPEIDAVTPVPIHWSREASRGFNQSQRLSSSLGGATPLREDLITRVRRTRPQARLTAKQRAKNLTGAFRCKNVHGMRILLIDDVVTSGATLEECSLALRSRGAAWVGAITFAREIAAFSYPSSTAMP